MKEWKLILVVVLIIVAGAILIFEVLPLLLIYLGLTGRLF